MDAAAPDLDLEALLANLAVYGMRAVDVVTTTMEAEQAVVQLVTAALPNKANPAPSLSEAIAAGLDIDSVAAVLAAAVPRIEILARAHDRLSRSVRRTVALLRRLQNGWTGTRPSDTRAAMQKRQVKNAVGKKIREEADDEAAEDLFAELREQLDDPSLDEEIAATSVEEVVQRICRDIGLAARACAPLLHPTSAPKSPSSPSPTHPPDSS